MVSTVRRILHLRSSAAIHGPETQILQLMSPLRQCGFEVEALIFYRRRKQSPLVHPLVGEIRRRGGMAGQVIDTTRVSPRYVVRILEKVREDGVDLIHTHDYKANWLGAITAKLAEIPCIATVHLYGLSTLPLKLYRLVDLAVLRSFPRVITVSRALREELLSAGLSEKQVVTIHNAISLSGVPDNGAHDYKQTREILGIGHSAPVVSIVGRLARQKGHRYLLQSVKPILEVLPGTRFLVIGDGPERGRLEGLARSLQIKDAVFFLGYREDAARLMNISNVIVIPSLREGLPYVLLEALALGRPVVATPVGAVPELVRPGETGLLVPSKDPEGLAEAILHLFEHPDLAARLGRQGKELVAQDFSVDEMTGKTVQIYAEVLADRKPALRA